MSIVDQYSVQEACSSTMSANCLLFQHIEHFGGNSILLAYESHQSLMWWDRFQPPEIKCKDCPLDFSASPACWNCDLFSPQPSWCTSHFHERAFHHIFLSINFLFPSAEKKSIWSKQVLEKNESLWDSLLNVVSLAILGLRSSSNSLFPPKCSNACDEEDQWSNYKSGTSQN